MGAGPDHFKGVGEGVFFLIFPHQDHQIFARRRGQSDDCKFAVLPRLKRAADAKGKGRIDYGARTAAQTLLEADGIGEVAATPDKGSPVGFKLNGTGCPEKNRGNPDGSILL